VFRELEGGAGEGLKLGDHVISSLISLRRAIAAFGTGMPSLPSLT
jgi:hypothetical protein